MSIQQVPSFTGKKKEQRKKKLWISFLELFNNCLLSITKEENKVKSNIENNNKKLDKKISESNAHLSQRKSLIKQKNIITLERNNYEKQFNQYKKKDDQLNSQIEKIDKKKDDHTKNKKINLKLNEQLKIDFNLKTKKLELKKKFG